MLGASLSVYKTSEALIMSAFQVRKQDWGLSVDRQPTGTRRDSFLFFFLALRRRDEHILSMKCPCHGELPLTGPVPQDHLKLTHISDIVYSRRSFYAVRGALC